VRGVANPLIIVMPGLGDGIHPAGAAACGGGSGMDPGVKPGTLHLTYLPT